MGLKLTFERRSTGEEVEMNGFPEDYVNLL